MNPIAEFITWLRERPLFLRAVFYGMLAVFVLIDIYSPRHEAHFWGDNVRGFWAIFGLVGCLAMARFMKGLGHIWLMKPTNFYDKPKGEE